MTLVSDAPTQAMPPMPPMQAPFPWMGGKRRVASVVWERFGDVKNYVEPFFGSGAVLLGRPTAPGIETVNDLDGFVANVWRALQADPEGTAEWADWPVNECDLHARHLWLVAQKQGLAERLMGDPDWYDAKIAGWWLWGMACWIGGGFCLGRGPWISVDGVDDARYGGGADRLRKLGQLRSRPGNGQRQAPSVAGERADGGGVGPGVCGPIRKSAGRPIPRFKVAVFEDVIGGGL